MTCTNCGQEITADPPVIEDGYHFCTALCRFEWRSKGKPTPFARRNPGDDSAGVAVTDLEFPVDPPGFEHRNMRVRLSYWTAPKLFLDGNRLQPAKSGFFRRDRDYTAVSNFGKTVPIRIRRRPLDQVPEMSIDGQPFLIARPLTSWEYVWIAIPLFMLFAGGAIGALVGGAAVFSNSILMRRIQHWIPRYLITGGTTVMAFFIFLQLVGGLRSFVEGVQGALSDQKVNEMLVAAAVEANRGVPQMIDDETRFDSLSAGPGKLGTYHYTLVRQSAAALDIPGLKERLRPHLGQSVRSNPGMETLRNFGVTFVYSYVDREGHPLFDLSFTPPDYK